MRIVILIVVCGVLASFFLAPPAFAQSLRQCRGIVPCGCNVDANGTVLDKCTFNDFLIGIKNLTNYLIVLAASLAALAFAWAGILYLTAGGNPSQIETAHTIFWKVFKGFIVMLAAWLIVYTITAALIPKEKRDQGFTLLKEAAAP